MIVHIFGLYVNLMEFPKMAVAAKASKSLDHELICFNNHFLTWDPPVLLVNIDTFALRLHWAFLMGNRGVFGVLIGWNCPG